MFKIIFFFILSLQLGCTNPSKDSPNQLTKDSTRNATTIVHHHGSFVKNYGTGHNNPLFAFVGEKISIEPLPYKQGSMDNGFKAKFAIIKKIYGSFPEDTIEFLVYDHYGTPAFSNFKNVLLYVSADSGIYYHQKYLYNDVYQTKDGRWAGTYADDDYAHTYNKRTKIRPVKIEFAEKVGYPLELTDTEGNQLVFSVTEPFYKKVGDSAIAVYGNYAEDLFDLKKTGVLTARELFKATAQQEEDEVEASQPEPRKTPPSADDLKFLAFWKRFTVAVKQPGLKNFREIALDSLIVCGNLISTGNFIDKCFNEVIDDEVRKRIIDKTKLEYEISEVEFSHLLTSDSRKNIRRTGNQYRMREMLVTRSTKNDNPPTIRFDFIETKKGYRLYKIDHHWAKDCCE